MEWKADDMLKQGGVARDLGLSHWAARHPVEPFSNR